MTKMDKNTRVTKKMQIKSMVPYFKAGLMIIPTEDGRLESAKGGMAALIDELTRYPKVANDDCVDALSYMNQLTKRPNVVSILRKIPAGSFMAIRTKIRKPSNNKLGIHNVREKRYVQA
jgi:hypothetical protein